MEVRSNRQSKADQRKKRRNRMHDENGGKGLPRSPRDGEIAIGLWFIYLRICGMLENDRAAALVSRRSRTYLRVKHTQIVSNRDGGASSIVSIAVPKYAKVRTFEATQWDGFDDRCGEGAEQQEDEGDEKYDRKRCRWAQHLVMAVVSQTTVM